MESRYGIPVAPNAWHAFIIVLSEQLNTGSTKKGDTSIPGYPDEVVRPFHPPRDKVTEDFYEVI